MALLTVKRELTGIAAIPKQTQREVLRVAIGKAGETWWAEMLPLHFTNRAYALYDYRLRRPGYERAKRMRRANGQGVRAIGEVKPNVWSGTSRQRATSTKNIVAKAPSSARCYVLVVVNAPALNFKHPKSLINMREEVFRVIAAEYQRLQSVFQAEAIKEFERRGHTFKNVKVFRAA